MGLSGSWQQTQSTAELSLRPILMSGGSLNYYITVFNSFSSHEYLILPISLKVTGVHAWCFPVFHLRVWAGSFLTYYYTMTVYISKSGQKLYSKAASVHGNNAKFRRDGQKRRLLAWVVWPGWVQCRCGVGGDLTIYWVAALCSFRADKSCLPGSCSPAAVQPAAV